MTLHLHRLGAGIIVLIDTMAETHQAEIVVLVLCAAHVFGNAVDGSDFFEHLERSLIGSAMSGAPETGNTRGDAGKGICAR